jgi:hypothetical protein
VNEVVGYALAVGALLVGTWAVVLMVRDRQVDNAFFYAAAVLELLLVVGFVAGCVALGGTSRDVDGVLFVSYFLAAVLAVPVALVWAIAEKSRWGTGVLVVAMLTVAVLMVRVVDIWTGSYV